VEFWSSIPQQPPCLWLGAFSFETLADRIWPVVTAQSPMQINWCSKERYQAGNFRGAISPWQNSDFHQKTNNRASEARA